MNGFHDREFWARYHSGDDERGLTGDLEVRFPWDGRLALELVAGPGRKALALVDPASGARHPLGWWDEARWHPFALRWNELERLTSDWAVRPDAEPRAPVPLLLLSCFVGFGAADDEDRASAFSAVAAGFRMLGLAAHEASALAADALPRVGERDYRWTRDPELGWIFGGGYPCYSLRNREHLAGAEGVFPFAELRARFEDRPVRGRGGG
ncbi:MAG TPA: hypothetical protein VF841_06890 [Anaeromyxobacter sp.]